ncbi:MAG: transglycosylase domain-containing protein [Rickettsiales bacterium]|nr:transglycosylase domain-containing protein [Rickettsiales bacterium]
MVYKHRNTYRGKRRFWQLVNSSLAVAVLLKILLFPIFFTKYYFRTMTRKPLTFLAINSSLLFGLIIYLLVCFKTLPDINKLYNYQPVLSSKFYDRGGNLIFEIGNEKRTNVSIKDIPDKLVKAFVAAEDKTFYTNPGLDIKGIIKTGLIDLYKFVKGQRLGGASTITQQIVKNVLLTNERTITRKLKEVILSYRISKMMSKEKIMEVYLNHIYLGLQAYGVAAASEEYFDKTLAQLTVPEMAMLASLPKAPSVMNPFKNHNRAMQRRNYVLRRMLEDGYITNDEYAQYVNTPLIVRRKRSIHAPFHAPVFFAQSLLVSKNSGLTRKDILSNGYRVDLTIDNNIQHWAQDALDEELIRYTKNHGYTGALFNYSAEELTQKTPEQLLQNIDEPENIGKFSLAVVLAVDDKTTKIGLKDNSVGFINFNDMAWAKQKISETSVSGKRISSCKDIVSVGDVIVVKRKSADSEFFSLEQIPAINGGVVVMNSKSGEILAMVGGYNDQAGAFNRAVQAFRQVGSAIKPFVYGAALDRGFTPASLFMDTELNLNIGAGKVWSPKNHNNKVTDAPMTMRTGLELSKNTVTVRVAMATGMKRIRNIIVNSGINRRPEHNLSIALGSVESSLVNMTAAYGAFANGGVVPNTYLISNVSKIDNSENILGRIYFSNCDINLKCDTDVVNRADISNKNVEMMISEAATEDLTDEENEERRINTIKEQENEQIARTDSSQRRPLTPESAYQITSMLKGAVLRGTSTGLSSLNIPIAAKTGTSNGGRDLWTIAFTNDIVIGVYVGHDSPMDTDNYGGTYALPIVRNIFSHIAEKRRFSDFTSPNGVKFVKIRKSTGERTLEATGKDVIFEVFKEKDRLPKMEDISQPNSSGSDGPSIDIDDLN